MCASAMLGAHSLGSSSESAADRSGDPHPPMTTCSIALLNRVRTRLRSTASLDTLSLLVTIVIRITGRMSRCVISRYALGNGGSGGVWDAASRTRLQAEVLANMRLPLRPQMRAVHCGDGVLKVRLDEFQLEASADEIQMSTVVRSEAVLTGHFGCRGGGLVRSYIADGTGRVTAVRDQLYAAREVGWAGMAGLDLFGHHRWNAWDASAGLQVRKVTQLRTSWLH